MSDYGACINLTKKDKTPLTMEEIKLVKSELEKIKADSDFFDSLGDDFLFKTNEVANNNTKLHLVFSEYWHGEGDEEENFEFAKENDLNEVQKIAELLKPTLNELFDIKPEFENW
ncbi:hypothetical protein PG275_09055 [Riemerella anatipestifer]|nr:hypothetical protein [Riemerella anatipestifer]